MEPRPKRKPEIRLEILEEKKLQLEVAHQDWKRKNADRLSTDTEIFSPAWLLHNGYAVLYRWLMKHKTTTEIVRYLSPEARDDFNIEKQNQPYTFDRIVNMLKKAHEKWQVEGGDRDFNTSWIQKNYGGSAQSIAKQGGIEKFLDQIPQVKADFKRSKPEKVTPDTAMNRLNMLFERWKATDLNTRDKFSPVWIQENDSGLYSWMSRHGGVGKFIDLASQEIQSSYSRREQYSRETAPAIFMRAHAQWRVQDPKHRGTFKITWLQKNGFHFLTQWLAKDDNLQYVLTQISEDIRRDFVKERREKYNESSAAGYISEAYEEWKTQLGENKRSFNRSWLTEHGYGGLVPWLDQDDRLERVIALTSPEARDNFERRIGKFSENLVIEKLKEFHALWREEGAGYPFNRAWLSRHGLEGMMAWIELHYGGLSQFKARLPRYIADDMVVTERRERFTPEIAVRELTAAHTKWKAQDSKNRGRFNQTWLVRNGYRILPKWIRKHNILTLASDEIRKDFELWAFTLDSAIYRMNKAHEGWRERKVGLFNMRWLIMNGYSGLANWIRDHYDEFFQAVPEQIKKDFKKQEKKYNEDAVISFIVEAHTKWMAQDPHIRSKFNPTWLEKNGYKELYDWARKHSGIDTLLARAPREVQDDWEKRGRRKETPDDRLKKVVDDVKAGETMEAQDFRTLLNLCGGSAAIDILYVFHPEFQDIDIQVARSTLSDHLGNLLGSGGPKGGFAGLDRVAEKITANPRLQDFVYENFKQDCLAFYYKERRAGTLKSDQDIANAYLNHIAGDLGRASPRVREAFDDIIHRTLLYYEALYRDIDKPEALVDELGTGRAFPDLNQRVNTRELQEKQRLLIADQMGLGKSASVIFAKEYLGVQQAVLVVPSNLIPTWLGYLSDDSKRGGCFKMGKAPRVLVVEDSQELDHASEYPYVLISQEMLMEKNPYVEKLKTLNAGMLVVDEIHLLKNLRGTRSGQLLDLATAFEGPDKYKVMLSGTPVPNQVKDIGVILKLLHPEQFGKMDPRQLTAQIIEGQHVDLRASLVPYMQMKRLEDMVEMPPLTDEVVFVELSEEEAMIYEALLEEDEMIPLQKMVTLQKFLLNPELFHPTPGIIGTKAEKLKRDLREIFEREGKVVVFVNNFAQGILRGDNALIDQLGLEDDIRVATIHGKNREEREDLQREFRTTSERMLLMVSGDTASVGVDFSSADASYFYNEPWTEYDRLQQLQRMYRPPRKHALNNRTLIARNTIEQGIRGHNLKKYQAIERLLKGLPPSTSDQLLLKKRDNDPIGIDVSVELARFYFSAWDNLRAIFKEVYEKGEAGFETYLQEKGSLYAECYKKLGVRCYQANANRVVSALVEEMVEGRKQNREDMKILDAASGPEMLKCHIQESYQDGVTSLDMNKKHFDEEDNTRVVGSFMNMPFEDQSFDYLNLSLALHYTRFAPRRGETERAQALYEMSRVLKVGGRAIVNNLYSVRMKDMEQLRQAVPLFGLRVVDDYTGTASFENRYQSEVITLEKTEHVSESLEKILAQMEERNITDALKFRKQDMHIRDSRRVIKECQLNGRTVIVPLNQGDQEIVQEETQVLRIGRELQERYGSIRNIPREEIIHKGFVSMSVQGAWYLFKKLESGSGAIVIKEAKKAAA